jgi:chromate transport protein ChrA
MSWTIVQAAFKGLSIGVIVLLFMAVNKLRKAIPNNILSIVLFTLTLVGMLSYNLFQIKIPSISLIFIGLGLVVGLVMTLITRKEKKK